MSGERSEQENSCSSAQGPELHSRRILQCSKAKACEDIWKSVKVDGPRGRDCKERSLP